MSQEDTTAGSAGDATDGFGAMTESHDPVAVALLEAENRLNELNDRAS